MYATRRPFPKAGARKMDGKRQVRKRKSTILTDTPEKEKIQNEHNIRQEKKKKMAIKYPKKVKACKKLKLVKSHTTVDAVDEEMETFCLMCSGPYSQSRKSEKRLGTMFTMQTLGSCSLHDQKKS